MEKIEFDHTKITWSESLKIPDARANEIKEIVGGIMHEMSTQTKLNFSVGLEKLVNDNQFTDAEKVFATLLYGMALRSIDVLARLNVLILGVPVTPMTVVEKKPSIVEKVLRYIT
jgi:hypothetical protein